MKKSELKNLIREEIQNVLKENAPVKTTLKKLFPNSGMGSSSIVNLLSNSADVIKFNLPSPSADPVTRRILHVKDTVSDNKDLHDYMKEIVSYFGTSILSKPIQVTKSGNKDFYVTILDPAYVRKEEERRDRIFKSMEKDPGLAH